MARTRRTETPAPERTSQGSGQPKLRRGLGNRNQLPADVAASLARKERRRRTTELVAEGLSIRAAARQMGISKSQAFDDVRLELATPNEGAEDRRAVLVSRHELELTRLATQAARLRERIEAKGSDAMEAEAILIRNSQAKGKHLQALAHLQVPAKVEHTGANGGPIPVVSAQVSLPELRSLMDENEK
jgi:hypothetical protein